MAVSRRPGFECIGWSGWCRQRHLSSASPSGPQSWRHPGGQSSSVSVGQVGAVVGEDALSSYKQRLNLGSPIMTVSRAPGFECIGRSLNRGGGGGGWGRCRAIGGAKYRCCLLSRDVLERVRSTSSVLESVRVNMRKVRVNYASCAGQVAASHPMSKADHGSTHLSTFNAASPGD